MAATSADWPSHLVCCTHNFGSKEWPSPLLACHPPADVVGRLIFSPGKKASTFSEPVLKRRYLFPASLLFQEENRSVERLLARKFHLIQQTMPECLVGFAVNLSSSRVVVSIFFTLCLAIFSLRNSLYTF